MNVYTYTYAYIRTYAYMRAHAHRGTYTHTYTTYTYVRMSYVCMYVYACIPDPELHKTLRRAENESAYRLHAYLESTCV